MSNYLTTQPYKGARDFYPEQMRMRNYMFSVLRRVCERYGFEEYDFPILESLAVFASKTGEEIVNNQLFSFTDKGGRELAIRPELTPSTVRMIAAKYNEIVKPVKWFMIGNNWRFEKPQKGRGREFYQLEMNIFGVEGVEADFEIFSAVIDIMNEFGADESMYSVLYSDRRIISALLDDFLKLDSEKQLAARRLMDKRQKVTKEEFAKMLGAIGIAGKEAETIENFMNTSFDDLSSVIPMEILEENGGYQNIKALEKLLKENDLIKFCKFDPSIIRGFDYSDGLVYEVFDKNPENRRSLFGGERFDKLINTFGKYEMAATGFAMGDITLAQFLEGWDLLPELESTIKVLVTVFSKEQKAESLKIARELRSNGINVDLYPTPIKLEKQLKYADRKGIPFVIIVGEDEQSKGVVKIKDMKKKEQVEVERNKVSSYCREQI